MKKLLATVSAVALSLAIVAMPAVAASADEVDTTETVVTETVAPETVVPETTEIAPVETTVVAPVETAPTAPTELYAQRQSTGIVTTSNEPADHCTFSGDGWQPKVNVGDGEGEDPFYVTVPDGLTVVAYCVKAGNLDIDEPIVIVLDPAFVGDGVSQLRIDHPSVNSVSHYQLKVVTTDVCPDVQGTQTNLADCEPDDPGCDELTDVRFSVAIDDEECPVDPDVVTVTPLTTDQECVPSGTDAVGTLLPGQIQLLIDGIDGIEKIEYSTGGGASTEVDLTGGSPVTITGLAPGKYDFVVTVKDGYDPVSDFSATVKADNDPECNKQTICHWTEGNKEGGDGFYVSIDVSIKSIINVPNGHKFHEFDIIPPFEYEGGSFEGLNYPSTVEGCPGFELPTDGPVIPQVSFTPPTCDADGSYTLTSPAPLEGLPAKTVTWFVNGVETEAGTYSVPAGQSVTVKVVANAPDYVLDMDLPGGFVTEYTYPTYDFTAPSDCDLTTLALTGNDPRPALTLTAFLGLLGVALVRSSRFVNRARREA